MNTPVSFELAKLLKEKGFNKNVRQRWCIVENIDGDTSPFCQYDCGLYNWNNGRYPEYTSAPTIADVVMWLYEKHGIWIFILPQDKSSVDFRVETSKFSSLPLFILIVKYEMDLSVTEVLNTSDPNSNSFLHFDEPTEAYEKAIEYALNNLL